MKFAAAIAGIVGMVLHWRNQTGQVPAQPLAGEVVKAIESVADAYATRHGLAGTADLTAILTDVVTAFHHEHSAAVPPAKK